MTKIDRRLARVEARAKRTRARREPITAIVTRFYRPGPRGSPPIPTGEVYVRHVGRRREGPESPGAPEE